MEYTVYYSSSNGNPVAIQRSDGTSIPIDSSNHDFREFLEWNEAQSPKLDWETPIQLPIKTPQPTIEERLAAAEAAITALAIGG